MIEIPGKLHPNKRPINIYGAGVSGLLMAYFLKKNGHEVKIWEKMKVPGGKISTLQTPYGLAEKAANAIYTNDDVWELLKELKLETLSPEKKLKKLVFRNGRIHFRLFTLFEIFKLVFGLFKKIPSELNLGTSTLYDFLRPFIGKKIIEEVVDAGLGGVYAIKSKSLSLNTFIKIPLKRVSYFSFLRSLKKQLPKSSQKKTSVSFKQGMQEFVLTLAHELKENIYYGQSPLLNTDENNIICADANSARIIISDRYPKLANELKNIRYVPLATHTVFLRYPISTLSNAFGIVCSTKELHSKGILHNTSIFSGRSKHGMWSYTFITDIGLDYSGQIKSDIKKMGGDPGSITHIETTEWSEGIPAYNLERKNAIESFASTIQNESIEGLVLFGNYVAGISIREMLTLAKNFAIQNRVN